MITLDQLKDNYVMPLLNSTPFKFMIFTDAGNYRLPSVELLIEKEKTIRLCIP